MKTMLFVLALALGAAVPLLAQPRISVYASAGASLPAFPASFGDFYRTGPHLGAGVGVRLRRQGEASLAVQFSRYTLDEEALREEFDLTSFTFSGGSFRSLGLTLDLRYDFSLTGRTRPYALLGAGLYESRVEALTINDGQNTTQRDRTSEAVGGLMAGVGVRVPTGEGFVVFFEPRYTLLLTNKRLLFDEKISRHYFDLQVGVAFRP